MRPAAQAPSPLRTGPAHARLRAATADLHAGLDDMFAGGLDSPCGYRRYVLGMHRFALDYEVAVGSPPRHSAWLASDLHSLSLAPLPALGVQRPAPLASMRLGWHYVMAGSSMGARSLLRDALRLGYRDGHGATFLARHAASDEWDVLRERLQALDPADAPRMAEAEAGARAAFGLVQDCLRRSFDHIPLEPEPCR